MKNAPKILIKQNNIKRRYQQLHEDERRILKSEYKKHITNDENAFFYALSKAKFLTDEQLFFFSDMFDCSINDLFDVRPPKLRRLSDALKEQREQEEAERNKLIQKMGVRKPPSPQKTATSQLK